MQGPSTKQDRPEEQPGRSEALQVTVRQTGHRWAGPLGKGLRKLGLKSAMNGPVSFSNKAQGLPRKPAVFFQILEDSRIRGRTAFRRKLPDAAPKVGKGPGSLAPWRHRRLLELQGWICPWETQALGSLSKLRKSKKYILFKQKRK